MALRHAPISHATRDVLYDQHDRLRHQKSPYRRAVVDRSPSACFVEKSRQPVTRTGWGPRDGATPCNDITRHTRCIVSPTRPPEARVVAIQTRSSRSKPLCALWREVPPAGSAYWVEALLANPLGGTDCFSQCSVSRYCKKQFAGGSHDNPSSTRYDRRNPEETPRCALRAEVEADTCSNVDVPEFGRLKLP